MDFLVSLPKTSDSQDAIMVIVDRLTKRAKFVATRTTASAEDTATLFMKHYVKDHGIPQVACVRSRFQVHVEAVVFRDGDLEDATQFVFSI